MGSTLALSRLRADGESAFIGTTHVTTSWLAADDDDDQLPDGPDDEQFKVSPVRMVVVGSTDAGKFGFGVGNGLD